MDQNTDMTEMLALILQPAFCVQNAIITQCNEAAQHIMIQPGTPISQLLPPDAPEYEHFRNGCLYLTLNHGEHSLDACVNRVNNADIFVLEPEPDQAELKTMALVAKELRYPLSDVITAANQLFSMAENTDNPKIKSAVLQMNRRLYQMHRMVRNMSDAIVYAGGSSNTSCRDIVSVAAEIFERAEHLATHSGVKLEYSLPQEVISCTVDDQLLERAVYNLISNAIKFSQEGSTIRLSLTRQGKRLYLSVLDQGQGIPPGILRNVFRRYQRQPGLEDGRFGLGLGLELVRCAAAVHDGTVLIDQPEGSGTRVTMSIPIRQARDTKVRSDVLRIDDSCGRDSGLLELSDVLPARLYEPKA